MTNGKCEHQTISYFPFIIAKGVIHDYFRSETLSPRCILYTDKDIKSCILFVISGPPGRKGPKGSDGQMGEDGDQGDPGSKGFPGDAYNGDDSPDFKEGLRGDEGRAILFVEECGAIPKIACTTRVEKV